MRFPGGKAKCLTLSYDDAVEQDETLIKLMEKYGISGTFNINTGCYAAEGSVFKKGQVHRRMTLKKCRELYMNKPFVEIATHGLYHPFLTDIPTAAAVSDILDDRRNIEEQYGIICRGHAYPYGVYNDAVVEILRLCGIVYARTVESTHGFDLPDDWLRLKPTCHHNDAMLPELTDKFLADEKLRNPYLFYLWGHTYEFEQNDNWHVIEDFFKKVGNRDDIWYATNIEVYDYVQAYKSLVRSADGSVIYNPSATDLWISLCNSHSGDEIVKIPAGGSVSL